MPSFRSSATQARDAVSRLAAHGTPSHGAESGGIHSLGTERSYADALRGAAEWQKGQGDMRGLHRLSEAQARAYLAERASAVSQSTLDRDRQALSAILGQKLERVASELGRGALSQQGRAYTPAQVERIAGAQTPANGLATALAYAAGLRAHELLTLRPAAEQAPSAHREWNAARFEGREGERYCVTGKGGLVREVLIPSALAARLEATRLESPSRITDRGIYYSTQYAIGGGQAWSQSFSSASVRELGWTAGAHGLRHSYAQARLGELQARGHSYPAALGIVSQELGHFRAEITEVYLR